MSSLLMVFLLHLTSFGQPHYVYHQLQRPDPCYHQFNHYLSPHYPYVRNPYYLYWYKRCWHYWYNWYNLQRYQHPTIYLIHKRDRNSQRESSYEKRLNEEPLKEEPSDVEPVKEEPSDEEPSNEEPSNEELSKHRDNSEEDLNSSRQSSLEDLSQNPKGFPRNCAEIKNKYVKGIYEIQVRNRKFPVYCIPDPKHGRAWTVIQRRIDGSIDFFRNWESYKNGFGEMSGEYWLGLRKIFELTSTQRQELWIQVESFEKLTGYARYSKFSIGTAKEKYALKVDEYYGDAGDSLKVHDGMKFSTFDNDNDEWTKNCASKYNGAWWFKSCHDSHLNGKFQRISKLKRSGIKWGTFRNYTSLKYVHMAIRPLRYSNEWDTDDE